MLDDTFGSIVIIVAAENKPFSTFLLCFLTGEEMMRNPSE